MRFARTVAACVAVTVAAALSACGGLPAVSAVQQGSQVGEYAVQPVRVQPDGPTAGATPEQIVRGFLRAGAGAGFDDLTAKCGGHGIALALLGANYCFGSAILCKYWLENSTNKRRQSAD